MPVGLADRRDKMESIDSNRPKYISMAEMHLDPNFFEARCTATKAVCFAWTSKSAGKKPFATQKRNRLRFPCHGGRVTANFGGVDVVPLQGAHAPCKVMASRKNIQKNCLELLALVVDSLLWLKMKKRAFALSLLTITKTSTTVHDSLWPTALFVEWNVL